MNVLAHPFFIYLTHAVTWIAVILALYAMKNRLSMAFDIFTDSQSKNYSMHERDRLAGLATGIVSFSFLIVLNMNLIICMICGAIVGLTTPLLLARRRFAKYQKEFDASLVESLSTIASSLRAGLTLKDALIVASQNCPPAFSEQVTRTLKDYRFGTSIEKSLDGVRKRVRTQNANISFGALIIGTTLGGKLPETLARIVATIREVDRVEGRLKALTAQGRAQGALLCSMPVLVTVGLYIMERDKIEFMLASPIGQVLIALAVFLELVGIAVTMKVMKLDV